MIDDLHAGGEVAAGGDDRSAPRPNRRGFWVMLTALLLACVLLIGAIFANRPLKEAIAHSEWSLRRALADAERVRAGGGTFEQADAESLSLADDRLEFIGPDQVSTGPGSVSVYADATVWAAAVAARPDACFLIKQVAGQGTTYGSSTVCTGRAALKASDSQW